MVNMNGNEKIRSLCFDKPSQGFDAPSSTLFVTRVSVASKTIYGIW